MAARHARYLVLAGLASLLLAGCGQGGAPGSSGGTASSQSSRTPRPTSAPPRQAPTSTSPGIQSSQFLPQQCEIVSENTNAAILFTGGEAIQLCQEATSPPGLPGIFGDAGVGAAANNSAGGAGFSDFIWLPVAAPLTEATVCSGTTLGDTGYVVMDTGLQLNGEALCRGMPNG